MRKSRIPLVDVVEDASLPPDLAELSRRVKGLPDSVRAYAHRPEVLHAHLALEMALIFNGLVPFPVKLRVAYLTGRLNGGWYTAAHTGARLIRDLGATHAELARLLNDDPPTDDEAMNALVRYVRLTAVNKTTDESVAEVSRFYSPAEIVEVTCVIGFYCWTSRVHNAFGLEHEESIQRIGADRIPFHGTPV